MRSKTTRQTGSFNRKLQTAKILSLSEQYRVLRDSGYNTLYLGVFDEYHNDVSEGGAGGLSSCYEQV